MGYTLRYASVDELPPHLRALAQVKEPGVQFGDIGKPTPPRKSRRPRRDLEHNEQVVLMNRIAALAVNDPRFALAAERTHAIPNGGGRSRAEAGRLKAEGVKRGVSDLFVAFPVAPQHGLYIEMKAQGGKVSDEQSKWIQRSRELGYAAHVCWTADEAFSIWRAYVEPSFKP